jgi:hypothetical protein
MSMSRKLRIIVATMRRYTCIIYGCPAVLSCGGPVIKGRSIQSSKADVVFWQDDIVKRHDDSGILVARMRRCICVIPAYVDARHVLPAFFLRSRICHSHQRQAFVLGNPELFARVSRERLFVSGPPPPPGVFFLGLGAKSRNHSSRGVHRWCLHGPA